MDISRKCFTRFDIQIDLSVNVNSALHFSFEFCSLCHI